jgi:hypothetical protein
MIDRRARNHMRASRQGFHHEHTMNSEKLELLAAWRGRPFRHFEERIRFPVIFGFSW